MLKYVFLILILCSSACKSVDKTVATAFADIFTPGFNPDLMQLQLSLYHYKLTHPTWPSDSRALNQLLRKEALESIRINKYEVLEWSANSDTIEISYLLQYDESDSLRFKFLKGSFSLYVGSDSSLHSVHRRLTAEKWNNTRMEMNGEWIMKLDKQ